MYTVRHSLAVRHSPQVHTDQRGTAEEANAGRALATVFQIRQLHQVCSLTLRVLRAVHREPLVVEAHVVHATCNREFGILFKRGGR